MRKGLRELSGAQISVDWKVGVRGRGVELASLLGRGQRGEGVGDFSWRP